MLAKEKFKIISISKIIIAVTFMLIFFSNIYCEDIGDYEDQISDLLKEQRTTMTKMTGIDREIAEDQYDILELDSKVIKYTNEFNKIQNKIDDINKKLKEYEDALKNSGKAYTEAQEIYATRLRAIYEYGMPTITEMLITSKDISDFFKKITVYESVIKYDQSLVGNIKSQKQYIDYIKKDTESQKLQLDNLKKDVEKSSQALNDAREAKEAKIQELFSSKGILQARIEAIEKEKEDADKKIDQEIERIRQEMMAKAASANGGTAITFSGGQFAWPVPGYNMITTKFNVSYDPWGTGKTTVHMGLDVAGVGINGKPLVAMQDGIVTVAKYYGGYGNCVIINHGKSDTDGCLYISLYGHASALNVTEGQTVKKGDVIAYVGSTGNSTGPHLHLELHKSKSDGSGTERVDPLLYFPDISFVFL